MPMRAQNTAHQPSLLASCLALLAMLLLTSCGGESGRFRLEGRLRNMNLGEFWVYSTEGAGDGIDTIPVREGRFAYDIPLRDPTTLVIIFPNYSEQPVFAEPGATVEIKGDATHLKEMTIEGTDDNEDMTQLRMELNRLMPPDVPKAIEQFIREHTESPVSVYLLQRYYVQAPHADAKKAKELCDLLLKQNPDNGQLITLKKRLTAVQGGVLNSVLPRFTATDVKGQTVSEAALKSKVSVVSAWASWSYPSTDMQMRLKRLKTKYGDKLGVLSICLDGRAAACRERVDRDSLKWSTVCDGRMWDTPLMSLFGIANIPDCIVYNEKGRVVARGLKPQKLEDKINELLK